MIFKNKKGIALNQAFGAVLVLVLVAVLVIIAIFLFVNLKTTFVNIDAQTITSETLTSVTSATGVATTNASLCNFGTFAVAAAVNATAGGVLIPATNYSVDGATGVVTFIGDSEGFNNTNWVINGSFNWGGESCVAVETMITQFATYPTLVGLIGTIIFLGLVIGVLVASFSFGGKGGI